MTGLSVDAVNRYLVSTGSDGALRAWDFSKRRLKGTLDCGSPVSRMCHHADSALVAVACDDLHIRMYDIEVRARPELMVVDPKLYPEVLHQRAILDPRPHTLPHAYQ